MRFSSLSSSDHEMRHNQLAILDPDSRSRSASRLRRTVPAAEKVGEESGSTENGEQSNLIKV